jgi:hypothetical protein
MLTRHHFFIISAHLLLGLQIFAGVLSKNLIHDVQVRVGDQFLSYQKAKTFVVNESGVITAVDPNGAVPDDLLVYPRNPGETLEVLYLDKEEGLLYYKGSSISGERVGQIGVFGDNHREPVPSANRVTFSPDTSKLYWTSFDAVRSMNLNGSDHNILARSDDYNLNDLNGWAWLGIYPWAYSPDTNDWCYFQDASWVLHQPSGAWSHGLQAAGINGWTWWGAYPWVYVNGYASWFYVKGDVWTYFSKTASWDLLENTTAPTFNGTATSLHVDADRNELYFQLNAPTVSEQDYGTIEKLNPSNGQRITIAEMTNATHIYTLPLQDRLYWAESDGLYSTTLTGQDRILILSTLAIGMSPPVTYVEPAPIQPGSDYDLSMSPHSPHTQYNKLHLLGDSQEFNLGYGHDFIRGTFSWFRRPGGKEVVVTLTSDQPVSAFPEGESQPYPGRTVEEIYQSSNNLKNLPARITLTLHYRDSHHGTYEEVRYLVNQTIETIKGDFGAGVGDFTGVQLRSPPVPSYQGSITNLSEDNEGNLQVIIHEASGGSRTIGVNSLNQVIVK